MAIVKFEMFVSHDGNPIFKFKKSKSEAYALEFVDLWVIHRPLSNMQPTEIVWEIHLDATKCKGKVSALSELVYGTLPKGYIEDVPPAPLRIGECYVLTGTDAIFQRISEREYKLYTLDEFDALCGLPPQKSVFQSRTNIDKDALEHPSKRLSHPDAVRLMKDDFFWDASDNMSPFGSDDAWQVMTDFVERFQNEPVTNIEGFLSEEFGRLALCSFDFWCAQLTEPFGFELEDGNRIVIASAFSQLMLKGAISADLKKLAEHALKLSYSLNDFKEGYLDRLRRMEFVIETAPLV
jgi:uncharacterized protein YfeS